MSSPEPPSGRAGQAPGHEGLGRAHCREHVVALRQVRNPGMVAPQRSWHGATYVLSRGTEEFDGFMQSLLLVGSGHSQMVKLEDLEVLEHGMAMDRARTDKLPSTGRPWIEGTDPREDFEQIGSSQRPDSAASRRRCGK